ncbi:hypothetical protein YPPY60_4829, partial [Yersinia pestis PY-60]
MPLPQP